MPTANHDDITPTSKPPAPSRRALFGAGAALIVGGAIAATANAAPSGADAELIAACAEAVRCEDWRRRINRDDHATDDELTELNAAWHAAFERVAELPATTAEGIRAKADALRMAVLEFVITGPPRP